MEDIIEIFKGLPILIQIFWGCAIISSLFMLVQLILSLVGVGDAEIDFGGDSIDGLDSSEGTDLFTVKNITNFFVGFGWGGVSFASVIKAEWLLLVAAIACGCLFVALFVYIFKQLMKIEGNNAIDIEAGVGLVAEVYLRIPASRSGKGKVQVSLGGSLREVAAITDDLEEIPTGSSVVILKKVGEDTLLVSKEIK
ncbi:MAG: serine protease [Bacteroidaceae bacterium]|nr:serine protease [Bacteroidaceae bacterium]